MKLSYDTSWTATQSPVVVPTFGVVGGGVRPESGARRIESRHGFAVASTFDPAMTRATGDAAVPRPWSPPIT